MMCVATMCFMSTEKKDKENKTFEKDIKLVGFGPARTPMHCAHPFMQAH